ncbi:hypothetical protein [Acidovorax sp.]|uniref:hypothetical protein n=1 Tax=Acidovorax sp. TaxID=1872122 RepID=UPI0025C12B88|nr:hypothetical protein [Acidovorax sp.]
MYERILELFVAAGTPIAALVAALIAHRFGAIQADIARRQVSIADDAGLTARNKLRMDMYQERMQVYKAVRNLFGQFGVNGKISHDDEVQYLEGIASARWVFGKEVDTFLSTKLWGAIAAYIAAHNSYDEHANTNARADAARNKADRRAELLSMKEEVDTLFARFMEFEQ